ncbi:MAG: class I SAM-dependent methyltransferase [Candidatus Taylorbacteria bacterium]|nr:class I SAM-dependent methyltransferase [Candidatus Taylorbacteria bacterium]
MKENLPLGLLSKHLPALGLENPLYIENENDLFEDGAVPRRNLGIRYRGFASVQSAVVFLPKSKALIDMTLALVSGIVEEGGTVVLAGSNDAGIRSARDAYEKNIGPVDQKIVGNHSALYVGKNRRLSASKKLEDFLSYGSIIYDTKSLEVAIVPGVFSAGELDEGTKLLLDHIPYDRKKILDVGCGAGIIGAIYKKKNPTADVTMSDSSELAVFATRATFERNDIEAKILRSDVFDGIQEKFDAILCNPPFHKGVSTDYSFIEKFAKGAKARLSPNGEVWVVANAFLSYADILQKNIGPTEVVADDKRFKVYRSRV